MNTEYHLGSNVLWDICASVLTYDWYFCIWLMQTHRSEAFHSGANCLLKSLTALWSYHGRSRFLLWKLLGNYFVSILGIGDISVGFSVCSSTRCCWERSRPIDKLPLEHAVNGTLHHSYTFWRYLLVSFIQQNLSHRCRKHKCWRKLLLVLNIHKHHWRYWQIKELASTDCSYHKMSLENFSSSAFSSMRQAVLI